MLARVLIATFLVALALSGGARAGQSPEGQASSPRVVEITARRYMFEPSVVEATVGERLRLVIRSADGPHGLEIKQFKVSKEVQRGGAPVEVEFTADKEGTFPILCSLYCGDGHGDMKGSLVVKAQAVAAKGWL